MLLFKVLHQSTSFSVPVTDFLKTEVLGGGAAQQNCFTLKLESQLHTSDSGRDPSPLKSQFMIIHTSGGKSRFYRQQTRRSAVRLIKGTGICVFMKENKNTGRRKSPYRCFSTASSFHKSIRKISQIHIYFITVD